MRFLFLLVVVANIVIFIYGHGIFGTPPSEEGRQPRLLLRQSHQHAITTDPALETKLINR